VETKVCSRCGKDKPLSEYGKHNQVKSGIRPDCKECKRKIDREYRLKNRDTINFKEREKNKLITNKIKKLKKEELENLINEYTNLKLSDTIIITTYVGYLVKGLSPYKRHYFEKKCLCCNKTSHLKSDAIKKYIKTGIGCNYCKGSLRITNSNIEKKCKSCEKWFPSTNEYFGSNKNNRFGVHYYCLLCHRQKNTKRRESKEIRNKEYEQKKIRLKTDDLFRLTCNVRSLIGICLRNQGYTKKSKTYIILGCSFEVFKNHIESHWEDWMNWDNYGKYNGEENYGWDLDHIIPVSSAKCEEDIIRLNHHSNIQPLCSYVNRYVKRDIVDWKS
jgi:hypothetical protein